jgi:hypothetical protein
MKRVKKIYKSEKKNVYQKSLFCSNYCRRAGKYFWRERESLRCYLSIMIGSLKLDLITWKQ